MIIFSIKQWFVYTSLFDLFITINEKYTNTIFGWMTSIYPQMVDFNFTLLNKQVLTNWYIKYHMIRLSTYPVWLTANNIVASPLSNHMTNNLNRLFFCLYCYLSQKITIWSQHSIVEVTIGSLLECKIINMTLQ